MLQAKSVNNEGKQKHTHTHIRNSARIRHSFVSLLTPALHGEKAADVIPILSAPSIMCDAAFQTMSSVQH